jgi:hypothetical protein
MRKYLSRRENQSVTILSIMLPRATVAALNRLSKSVAFGKVLKYHTLVFTGH